MEQPYIVQPHVQPIHITDNRPQTQVDIEDIGEPFIAGLREGMMQSVLIKSSSHNCITSISDWSVNATIDD